MIFFILQPNPSPFSTSTPDFPCGICSHEVHEHHHAIQCDKCDCWYHTSCVQINYTTYEQLKHNSVLWFCSCCRLPDYSRCLFSSNITTSNKFSTLESLPDSSNHTHSIHDQNPIFAPNPANTSTIDRANAKNKFKLKAVLTNGNSVKSTAKVSQLQATMHSTNPDILFLVETKLDSSIPTYSFLPTNYEAIRKDRNAHGGGVLIALRNDIIADPQDKLNTTCEIVWTKMHFFRNKAVYLASYYRPPNDHTTSLHGSPTWILGHPLPFLQASTVNQSIAGDLNLPDINWENLCTTNQHTATKHNKLLEIVSEYGITNMVNEPTRLDSGNILDFVLTSNPALISNVNTVSGMSDHEAVLFQININPMTKILLHTKCTIIKLQTGNLLNPTSFFLLKSTLTETPTI